MRKSSLSPLLNCFNIMSKKRTRAELNPETENSVVVSPYFLRNRESSESMATTTTNYFAKENVSDPPAKKRKFFANVPKQEPPKQESMKVEVPRLKFPPPTKGEYLPEVADSIGPDLRLLFVSFIRCFTCRMIVYSFFDVWEI
jgi:hypothetical protein